jgi:hypothetical protein
MRWPFPLLDEAKRMEHTANHSIPKLGHSVLEVFNGEPEWEERRILHPEALIEDGNPDRRATLMAVRLGDSVDDGYANGDRRQVREILPPTLSDAVERVLGHEGGCVFDRVDWQAPNLGFVGDPGLVCACKGIGLSPGVGEMSVAVSIKEQHAADGWHRAPLIDGKQAKRLKIPPCELSDGSNRLGSCSEVHGFRVEVGHRLFVEAVTLGGATLLLDHLGVHAAVARADTDVGAGVEARSLEVVRTMGLGHTWMASSCVRRHGRISLCGTRCGAMDSLITFAARSSSSSAFAPPARAQSCLRRRREGCRRPHWRRR